MVTGIIGRKIGMTQLFSPDGTVHPATVLKAGPCVVVQAKAKATDGYDAVQLGLVEEKPARATKPLAGHYKKASVPPTRVRREVRVKDGGEAPKTGEQVLVSIFKDGERVDVIGTSRGKGFAGVVKRHHFRGGAATHGSMFHRAPGSIGASSYPSRVVKGMRAAGALLAPRLLAAAAHFRASLRRMRAAATAGVFADHRFPDQIGLHAPAENFVAHVERPDLLVL